MIEILMGAAPWLGLVLLGLLVGAFGTLIGAGGGFLLVPVLLLLYPNDSVSTITSISLAVVFCNAASGSVAYARLGRIDYRTGLVFAVAGIPGSILGSLATGLLPRGAFDVLFGIVLLVLATYLFLRGRVTEGHEAPKNVRLGFGAALSFGVGFLSSILGIGGGVVHVPLLIQFLGYPAHIATATSHFILALMSLAGTATHLLSGEPIEGLRRTLALGSGVLVGAQVGARLSQRVKGTLILRSLSVGIMGVGIRLTAKSMGAVVLMGAAIGGQLARIDLTVIREHDLAYPHATAGGVLASVAGLLAGLAILALLLMPWGRLTPTQARGARFRRPR